MVKWSYKKNCKIKYVLGNAQEMQNSIMDVAVARRKFIEGKNPLNFFTLERYIDYIAREGRYKDD